MILQNSLRCAWRFQSLTLFAAPFAGCGRVTDHYIIKNQDKIADAAVHSVPLLRQFHERFPEERHFISYITGEVGPTAWVSKAGVFQRYVIEIQSRATVDRHSFKVTLFGELQASIHEITDISKLPDSRSVLIGGAGFDIPTAVFREFLSGKRTIDELGFKFIKDRPVPGFSSDVTAY